MTKLWQRLFDISNFYSSGIDFPFREFKLDSKVCFRISGKEKCTAYIAVEAEEPMLRNKAEQTILEIATIYALLTRFSFSISPGVAQSLESLEELGRHDHLRAVLGVESVYTEEQLKQHSEKLSANWQKTREVWIKVKGMLHKKNFLRLALFYYYRSGLGPGAVYGGSFDDALIDAAIGLEALFNDGPQDIAYKLAARAALLLSCLDKQDQNDVFESLKYLYNKRNNIVHGIKREKIEWKDYDRIRKFLRSGLRSCLALAVYKDKKQIIGLIDRALVRPEARKELTEAIQNGIIHLGL